MLCLITATAKVALGVSALTLAWTHSVQKTRWEEDWQLQDGRLVLLESRIEGTGAGMEPPPNARFDGHVWRYRPAAAPLPAVTLRRSGATADWEICRSGRCTPLGSLLEDPAADPVILTACPAAK